MESNSFPEAFCRDILNTQGWKQVEHSPHEKDSNMFYPKTTVLKPQWGEKKQNRNHNYLDKNVPSKCLNLAETVLVITHECCAAAWLTGNHPQLPTRGCRLGDRAKRTHLHRVCSSLIFQCDRRVAGSCSSPLAPHRVNLRVSSEWPSRLFTFNNYRIKRNVFLESCI